VSGAVTKVVIESAEGVRLPAADGYAAERRRERKRARKAAKALARRMESVAESCAYTRWRREQQLADLQRDIALRHPVPAAAPVPPSGPLAKLACIPALSSGPLMSNSARTGGSYPP
jgi:hypothetical protein